MPSFTFLKSSRGESQQIEGENSGVSVENETKESKDMVPQRSSKRHFFRSLLKRSSLSSEARANRRRSGQFSPSPSLPLPSPKQNSPLPSPMDKPLPPPPPGSEPETTSSAKNPVKLDRIISPLSPTDLHKIFSGAPQFFARSEGHHTGAPHPSVAFPWDSDLTIRDLCDHRQIQDEAWGCVTAWPHITLQVSKNPEAKKEHCEKHRAHFLPRCRERPNMLSMQGTERGTMGYQAALEIGVADALEIPEDGTPELISEHRKKFLNGKDGLRPLTDSTLIDRLVAVSEVYQEDPLKHRRPTLQMYTELFTQILFPPSRVTDSDDPYSLQVQVESLVQVLAAPMVWVDFGLVEWRIRLGHILWGSSTDSYPEDEVTVNNEVIHEPGTQKYWLLLQILLSCELLVRLDAISSNIDHGLEAAKPTEIKRFEAHATSSVKWSMILARVWLENIRIKKLHAEEPSTEKKSGWLATLTGTGGHESHINQGLSNIQFHGRHQAQQLAGLIHFAKKLEWPNLDQLKAKVSANTITISDSVQNTPIAGTPMTVATGRTSSYFATNRPKVKRGLSSHKNVSAIIHPAGWLSNSYISGLILPGEGLSHFLISTLLENDDAAVARLGVDTNLYGGFIYDEKSFWSTSCVVGRVLAAGKGAAECMGWVSSHVLPRGASEGWVDIDVELAPRIDSTKTSSKPRLWQKSAVEHDSSILGGADTSTVLPGDFILPSDSSTQPPLSVTFESLDLFATTESVHSVKEDLPSPMSDDSDAPGIRTYSALMRFTTVAEGEDKKEVNISLTYDVFFVTAHPCTPSAHAEILKTPTSPAFRALEQPPSSPSSLHSHKFLGHPLHKAYTYTKLPLLTLLSLPTTTPFTTLLSPTSYFPSPSESTTHTTSSTIPKVLVIDCTDLTMFSYPMRPGGGFETDSGRSTPVLGPVRSLDEGGSGMGRKGRGSDLEILARAVCSERGWNALVSRRGRGCLACAVREAGGLGWRVVLRVA